MGVGNPEGSEERVGDWGEVYVSTGRLGWPKEGVSNFKSGFFWGL